MCPTRALSSSAMSRFPRANRDLRRPEACEPVGLRKRTPWQCLILATEKARRRKGQLAIACLAGIFYGRDWARTSDPQLVDSEQRSRRFARVRPKAHP